MNRVTGVLLLTLSVLFTGCTTKAADSSLFIDDDVQRLFTSEDGLLSTSSTAIAQTEEGFIWIGGYGGLVRYDGHAFIPYKPGEFSNIRDMLAGPDGELWIASPDLGLIRYKDDVFENLENIEGAELLEPECLAKDDDGVIWIGTADGIATAGSDGTVRKLSVPELRETYITHIVPAADGKMLLVARSGDLYCYDGDTCAAVDLGEESHYVRSVCYDRENRRCYIGTTGHTLICCDESLNVLEVHKIPETNCINQITCGEGGALWLCADNGVGIWEDGKFRLQRLLLDNSIDRMMIDSEGSFWFISSRQGVLEVSESRFGNISRSAGLDSLVVNALQRIGNRLYIAHDDGLKIIDINTYELIEDPDFSRLEGVRIRSLYADAEGGLWIATKGKGLLCHRKNGEWKEYTSREYPVIQSDNFRCIYQGEDALLAGTDSGAYEIREDEVLSLTREESDFTRRVLCICEYKGCCYLGTDGYGLYAVKDGKIIHHLSKDDGLNSNVIMKVVYSETEHCFWLVTGNNLAWVDEDMTIHNVEHFPSTNNLDFVKTGDDVWIPAGGGVFRTTEDALQNGTSPMPVFYRHNDGLPYEIAANSNQCLDGDLLYLCGSGGVTSVKVGDNENSTRDWQLVVDSIKADGARIYVQNQDQVKIDKDVRRIEVNASLVTYRSDDPIVFYYLEGFENERTICRRSDFPSISYTNLDGGDYVFHYGVLNDADGEPVEELTLSLHKEYHWYETRHMQTLLVFAAMLAIVLVTLLLARIRAREENRRMKKEFEEKEKEHLSEMAFQDYLTGLFNRNYLEVWIERVLPNSPWPVTFLTIDCNNLKKINDHFGHKKGDQLLMSVGRLLKEEFTGKDSTILRYGGDEFLVLCVGIDEKEARERILRVRTRAAAKKIEGIPITFSYGSCTMTQDNYDFEEGLRLSDMEMLEEKGRFHGRRRTDREKREAGASGI